MKPYPLLALLLIPAFLLQGPAHASPTIPLQTDDGLDPVNLVFTGDAPATWVAQNLQGWNPTPCTEPKTLYGRTYDISMETPDTRVQAPPCWGPRYHIRIWDMGTDQVLGHWSIGAVHYEHTECTVNPPACRHVVDSWEKAESLVRSTFASGNVALSITSLRLNNLRSYQEIPNDGNATAIQLSPVRLYSVTFQEIGLPANTPWSITMNGTTSSSTSQNITVRSPEANYSYKVGDIQGYVPDSANSNFNLTANRVIPIRFTSTRSLVAAANLRSMVLLFTTGGVAWLLVALAAVFKTIRNKRNRIAEKQSANSSKNSDSFGDRTISGNREHPEW